MAENRTTSKQRAKDFYQPNNLLKQYRSQNEFTSKLCAQVPLAPTLKIVTAQRSSEKKSS